MITYFRDEGELELTFQDEELNALVETVPGAKYSKSFRMWTVPDTPQTWDLIGEHLVDGDDSSINLDKTLEVSQKTTHPDYSYLMAHQAQVVNTALGGHPKLYLGLPAGTGKSLASFASMDALNAYPLLIVCLSVNKVNWQRELKKFAGLESQILEGRTPKPITENVVIINYDILNNWKDALIDMKFKGVIFDEAAWIKNPDSVRTKASLAVSKRAKAVMALSGTPTPSSPRDLVAPLQALDYLSDFGGSQTFIDRYCPPKMTEYGLSYSNYQNLDELYRNLKHSCFIYWDKNDLIDLPPLNIYAEIVDGRSISVERMIRSMKSATLEEALAAISKEDALFGDGVFARMRHEAGEIKTKYIIEEASAVAESEKVVVGVHHRDVNDAVTEALSKKFKTVQIIGGMSPKKRQEAIDAFQDGDAQVLVMSIVAGGVAINLQNASHMVVGELPITYADFDQLISRIYRAGQKNKVSVVKIVCPGTADDILVGLGSKKEGLHHAVTKGEDLDITNIREVLARYLVERKKKTLED